MFEKLFRKPKKSATQEHDSADAHQSTAEVAMIAAIEAQKKSDPLVGAKIAGKEIVSRLINGMKNEKGVHVESLLCALGALAGYSCQANLRAQAIARGLDPNAPFQVVKTNDGEEYYFGDPLNEALAEGKLSVWSLAAAAAQDAGANSLPDLNEIFQHTASVLGSDQFGLPRFPSGHNAGDVPANYLTILWPVIHPVVQKLAGEPILWPVAYGLAVQEVITTGKTAIAPELAVTLVMEAAIPMSKVRLTSS